MFFQTTEGSPLPVSGIFNKPRPIVEFSFVTKTNTLELSDMVLLSIEHCDDESDMTQKSKWNWFSASTKMCKGCREWRETEAGLLFSALALTNASPASPHFTLLITVCPSGSSTSTLVGLKNIQMGANWLRDVKSDPYVLTLGIFCAHFPARPALPYWVLFSLLFPEYCGNTWSIPSTYSSANHFSHFSQRTSSMESGRQE